MTKKSRQHFNKWGRPKKAFESAKHARRIRDRVLAESGDMWRMRVYKCVTCGLYHLGNKEYWRVRRSMERRDDMLTGKLVYALRLVLDKEPHTSID